MIFSNEFEQKSGIHPYLHARLVAQVGDDGVVVRKLGPLDLKGVPDALVSFLVREVVVDNCAVLELESAFVGSASDRKVYGGTFAMWSTRG